MEMLKRNVAGFIVGMLVVVAVFYGYILFSTRTTALDAQKKVDGVIQYINQINQQNAQKK